MKYLIKEKYNSNVGRNTGFKKKNGNYYIEQMEILELKISVADQIETL